MWLVAITPSILTFSLSVKFTIGNLDIGLLITPFKYSAYFVGAGLGAQNNTLNKLKSIGIENIVNTSCPTFWNLSSEKCASISRRRKGNVVTTLTFYHRDYKADKGMLEILSKKYAKVHLWIQGLEDINYYEELGANLPNLFFIPPTIEAYNRILDTGEVDYIGTRLHAGARALQKKVRTLILAVDNRAKEIGKDINLNVIDQKDYTKIESFIDEEYITDIQLPVNEIRMWKESLIVK